MIKDLRKKKKKGFSLVELIVVIAIIGILAAIAVPKYSKYKESANLRAMESSCKLIAEATLMAHESGELDTGATPWNGTKFVSDKKDADGAKVESTDEEWDIVASFLNKNVTDELPNAAVFEIIGTLTGGDQKIVVNLINGSKVYATHTLKL